MNFLLDTTTSDTSTSTTQMTSDALGYLARKINATYAWGTSTSFTNNYYIGWKDQKRQKSREPRYEDLFHEPGELP